MAMAFFKMSSYYASRFIGRAQSPNLGGLHLVSGLEQLGRFLPSVEPLGADVRGAGGGPRRAAFAGHPQSFGAAGRIKARPFRGKSFFMGLGSYTRHEERCESRT